MNIKQMLKPKIKSFSPFKSNTAQTNTDKPIIYNHNISLNSQHISAIVTEEKPFYDITTDVAANIKAALIEYYKTNFPFQVFLRQNKYLIPFKRTTSATFILQNVYESNTNLHKDIYIQIHNIDNNIDFIVFFFLIVLITS